jgi:hypothetical protein
VKTRVPDGVRFVPILVQLAVVGSNHRALVDTLIAVMSTVIVPLCAGGT